MPGSKLTSEVFTLYPWVSFPPNRQAFTSTIFTAINSCKILFSWLDYSNISLKKFPNVYHMISTVLCVYYAHLLTRKQWHSFILYGHSRKLPIYYSRITENEIFTSHFLATSEGLERCLQIAHNQKKVNYPVLPFLFMFSYLKMTQKSHSPDNKRFQICTPEPDNLISN